MDKLKEHVERGDVELVRMGPNQQPVPMQMSELEERKQRIDRQGAILKKLKELSPEEKAKWVHNKRLSANQLVRNKKWQQGIEVYLEAMLGVELKQEGERQRATNREVKYPLMLNIATCQFQLKEYRVAQQLCEQVIKEEDGRSCLKAHFKLAHCLSQQGLYSEARQEVKATQRLLEEGEPQVGKPVTAEDLAELTMEIRRKSQSERDMYARIFNEKEEESEGLMGGGREEVLVYREGWGQWLLGCCRGWWSWEKDKGE